MVGKIRLLVCSVALAVLLGACGFKPLYGPDSASSAALTGGMIDVSPIPDRLGQQVRGRLQDRLGVSASPRYRLNITITNAREGIAIRPDAAATQEQLTVYLDYQLIDAVTNDAVIADRLMSRITYDIVLSDFATLTQREDSIRRLAFELSDRMERQIAVYLNRGQGDGSR